MGNMADRRTTLLQGTLDLLILKALSAGELHGLGVSRRIEQITGGTFVVQPSPCSPRSIAWRRPAGSNRAGSPPRTTAGRSTTS